VPTAALPDVPLCPISVAAAIHFVARRVVRITSAARSSSGRRTRTGIALVGALRTALRRRRRALLIAGHPRRA
jgi:hypothetical protein